MGTPQADNGGHLPALMAVAGAAFLLAVDMGWAVSITRGPYLQLQTPESIHVVWLTDVACVGEVEWGPTSAYGHVNSSGSSATRHEIAITGLAPDTLYHYRVRAAGTPLSADTTLRTAPPADSSSISFSFVGDSCSAPGNAAATYNAMLAHSPNGFCVTLGDLAGRGEDNLTDYWQSHFFAPAAPFVKQVSMYPCIGNHELYDETSFPDFVYPVKYLDNWSLPTDNSGTEFYYSFDKGPVHFVSVDNWWSSYSPGSSQYNWLAGDLAATDRTWKIVFAHNGPYVSQSNKSDGSLTVRSNLVPLLEQRGVDLFLHGHYHEYQRNHVNGVTYVLQGTGGQSLGGKSDDSQSYVQAYAAGEYCFTRLDIQGNRMLGQCLRTSDGVVLDGWQLDKPPISMPWHDNFPPSGTELNWTAPWNCTSQCGLIAQPDNPSGDDHVFAVADSSGHQFAYPMLADTSLNAYSLQAQVYYNADSAVRTRLGIGVRGRQLFSTDRRSYYGLFFVRNDPLAANGQCVLVRQSSGTETVLAQWPNPDVSGWHGLKLSAAGTELSVWIDDQLQTPVPISDGALAKGRPFIYNYRANSSGAKTIVDDVLIAPAASPALITDFEGYADGTQVMFRQPSYSGSTSGHLAASPNTSQVVTEPAFGGTKVCRVDWAFVDSDPQRWLRLTTSNAANVGNPAVDLTRPIRFRYRLTTPGSLRMCVGIRETGTDVPIGADGGTSGTMEWLGASSVQNDAPQGVPVSDAGGQWQEITFDPVVDPVQAFTGDGVLSAANNMGVLEHLALTVVDGEGPFSLQLDLFEQPWREPLTPPTITQDPINRTVCPGDSLVLTVAAAGSMPLTYRWRKDGMDLTDGGGYGGVTTSMLSITGANKAHAGLYSCLVTNALGSVSSNQAELVVWTVFTITAHPQAQTIFTGQNASFTVAATGEANLSYQWEKDGVVLVPGGKYTGVNTPVLTVSNATSAQAGAYRCQVIGACGHQPSEAALLTILPAYRGDFDYDGDVDQEDFGFFQRCLERETDPLCGPANLDDATVIDHRDLLLFLECLSGPGRTPPSACLR